jgi:hypothetical protein
VVPIDLLDTLRQTWEAICHEYDARAALPEMEALFDGADLASPSQASETTLANILTEVMERFGRFSPWYRTPAAAFGLILIQDSATGCARWGLSPDAAQRWQPLLSPLAHAIERNIGLILSVAHLGDLEKTPPPDGDPCVMASCACVPPRVILVHRSILVGADIRCETCQRSFQPVEDGPDADLDLDW